MVISPSATSATPPSSTPVVTVDRLRKTYGATVAVEDVSLTVREGEVLGIIGPNGAGKTTTVECISGLRAPDSGEIRVFGLDPRRDRRRIREMVGVQLQEGAVPPNVRVGEAVELFASFYRSPAKTDELLHERRSHRQTPRSLPPAIGRVEATTLDRARTCWESPVSDPR